MLSILQKNLDARVFGAQSDGSSGGGGGSSGCSNFGDVCDDGAIHLGTIVLTGGQPGGTDDDDGGASGGGSGSGGSGTPSEPTPDPNAQILDTSYVNNVFAQAGVTTPNPPIYLMTANDYLGQFNAEITELYEAYEDQVFGIIAADPSYLEDMTTEEIADAISWYAIGVTLYFPRSSYSAIVESFEPYLEMRRLIDEGASSAEAYLQANDVMPDEFVFADDMGRFAEFDFANEEDILVSSGIDVSNGVMIVDPVVGGIPTFALPHRPGMDEYDALNGSPFDWNEPPFQPPHTYQFSYDAPAALTGFAGLDALEAAIRGNPTPGVDAEASIGGTLNDVGPLNPILPDWAADNFVYSFVVENPNAIQTDIIVNYTQSGNHAAADGIVVQYGVLNDDGSIDLVVYGEGDSFIQNTGIGWFDEFGYEQTDEVWENNSLQTFNDAVDML